MFEQVKKKDGDDGEQKDGERDGRVGPEVEVGEVEGGHYGERLHLAEAHPWQGHQSQTDVEELDQGEGGEKEQLHSCLPQGQPITTKSVMCHFTCTKKEKVTEEIITSVEL